jgi:hypothetical protein
MSGTVSRLTLLLLFGAVATDRGADRQRYLVHAPAQLAAGDVLAVEDLRADLANLTGEPDRPAIDQALRPVPGLPPVESLGFQFNPSEFSETGEDLTVERLNTVATYIEKHHPGVSLFTPSRLGVMVHPLMFYDLEAARPRGVYDRRRRRNFEIDLQHLVGRRRRQLRLHLLERNLRQLRHAVLPLTGAFPIAPPADRTQGSPGRRHDDKALDGVCSGDGRHGPPGGRRGCLPGWPLWSEGQDR